MNNKDQSNGYEAVANTYISARNRSIGRSIAQQWAQALPKESTVLDLGCGTGIPISKVLIDEGMNVYGIDASPTLVSAFRLNFPATPIACESVEESLFFNIQFDAVVAWGLVFLLSPEGQELLIHKVGLALKTGGRLLFTSPAQMISWKDAMTNLHSQSLGAKTYQKILSQAGLSLIEELDDEGKNHYYHAIKT